MQTLSYILCNAAAALYFCPHAIFAISSEQCSLFSTVCACHAMHLLQRRICNAVFIMQCCTTSCAMRYIQTNVPQCNIWNLASAMHSLQGIILDKSRQHNIWSAIWQCSFCNTILAMQPLHYNCVLIQYLLYNLADAICLVVLSSIDLHRSWATANTKCTRRQIRHGMITYDAKFGTA